MDTWTGTGVVTGFRSKFKVVQQMPALLSWITAKEKKKKKKKNLNSPELTLYEEMAGNYSGHSKSKLE